MLSIQTLSLPLVGLSAKKSANRPDLKKSKDSQRSWQSVGFEIAWRIAFIVALAVLLFGPLKPIAAP